MPAVRSTRRSRRLSNRPPTDPEFETLDDVELTLLHPEDEICSIHPRATHVSTCSIISRSDSQLSLLSSPISEDAEDAAFVPRTSHGRRKKEGHIPRPPNAFIMYRSEYWREQKVDPRGLRDHREISKAAGMAWRDLSSQRRKRFEEQAKARKAEHERMYPGYRYAPASKGAGETKKRKNTRDLKAEAERCKKAADAYVRRVFLLDSTESPAASPTSPVIHRSASEQSPPSSPAKKAGRFPSHRPASPSKPRRLSAPAVIPPASPMPVIKKQEETEEQTLFSPVSYTPELFAPSPPADDDFNCFVPTDQIPLLDLSVPGSGVKVSPDSWTDPAPNSESLFTAPTSFDFISQLWSQTDMSFPIDQGSSSSSLSNSPERTEYPLMYPDTRSDLTDSPTSGLLSSPGDRFDLDFNDWLHDTNFPIGL